MRILLADDNRMFREALRGLLQTEPGLDVVGEARDGQEVLELALRTAPDIVCMDVDMPGVDGIEATRRLLAANPAARVIALSAHPDQRYVEEMLAAGAQGYVTKSEIGDHLLHAIHAVGEGRKYLSDDAANVGGDLASPASTLRSRETEIMQLLGAGHPLDEIARRLGVPSSMVDAHQRKIMRKLNLRSLVDLTLYASKNF